MNIHNIHNMSSTMSAKFPLDKTIFPQNENGYLTFYLCGKCEKSMAFRGQRILSEMDEFRKHLSSEGERCLPMGGYEESTTGRTKDFVVYSMWPKTV